MPLADRLLLARKHAGLTQKELADRVGLSQTAVHKLEQGRSRSSRRLVHFALVCGVDPVWLSSGQGEMVSSAAAKAVAVGVLQDMDGWNVSEDRMGVRHTRAPLLSWDEVGLPLDTKSSDSREWVPVTRRASRRVFAVRVTGDSMATEFAEGDVLIVDPVAAPENKSFIVVKLPGDPVATFKQLIIEGGHRYLKSINICYPMFELAVDAVICGVVVSKLKYY